MAKIPPAEAGQYLRVNPITCVARGMCAELLPEQVKLDEWGYPILKGDPLPPQLVTHARRAIAECPTLALRADPTPKG